ncbi:uncharacterized protein LOC133199614 [Saccostrea echinata]|uniref:uncharacterized protein LOC133199614 n=1 Tax=Saccostrea echinata TaxID=191078 RepID=UPI002A7FD995|nr:uncharacterized protein LOC133199614 [Saccostrea echinata]
MILTISMCIMIIIRCIETKRMIDIDNIKFKLPCGNNYCDGIIKYCSEEQTCLYCTTEICESRNPPEMCVFQCETYKIHPDSKTTNQTRSTTEEDSIGDKRVCADTWVVVLLGVTFCVLLVILGVIFISKLIMKKDQMEKYYVDDCFIICRKRNIHELLRKYHTTEKHPEST